MAVRTGTAISLQSAQITVKESQETSKYRGAGLAAAPVVGVVVRALLVIRSRLSP